MSDNTYCPFRSRKEPFGATAVCAFKRKNNDCTRSMKRPLEKQRDYMVCNDKSINNGKGIRIRLDTYEKFLKLVEPYLGVGEEMVMLDAHQIINNLLETGKLDNQNNQKLTGAEKIRESEKKKRKKEEKERAEELKDDLMDVFD